MRRSFAEIKPSRNSEITLSITDVGTCKSNPRRELLTWQMFPLTLLFAKMKFSRQFPNLQYVVVDSLFIVSPIACMGLCFWSLFL